MERKDIAAMLALVTATIPETKAQITKQTAEAWLALMGELDADLALQALRRVLAQHTYPTLPMIGAIRREAAIIAHPDLPLPEAAWGEVVKAIRTVGHTGRPSFSHPLIARIVETIGWRDLCVSETPSVDRGQFLKLYGGMREHYLQDAQMPADLRMRALQERRGGTQRIGEALRGVLPEGNP